MDQELERGDYAEYDDYAEYEYYAEKEREEYAGKELPMPVELERPKRKRLRFTIETTKHQQPPTFIDTLKRERKTIYYCLLAVIIFTLLALLMRLCWGSLANRDKQLARLHAHKVAAEFTPLHMKEMNKAKEQAKRAEQLAEKAMEKEKELAREVEALKELMRKHGMEPDTQAKVANTKKAKSWLGQFANLFQASHETEIEKEREFEGEHEKSIQKALERITNLEDETDLLKQHAVTVESQLKRIDEEFDTVAANMRLLDRTVAADFASVDTDLQIVDTALAASLDRHQEERDKINEMIDHLHILADYAQYHDVQVEKIGGLEQSMGEVKETTEKHSDRLDEHDAVLERHEASIVDLQTAVEGHSKQIKDLNKDLREKTEQLRNAITAQSTRHDILDRLVSNIQDDLHNLHEAVTADLTQLQNRIGKVKRMAEKPMQALNEYRDALASVSDTVNSMQSEIAVGRPAHPQLSTIASSHSHSHSETKEESSEYDAQEWADRYLTLEKRVRFLEESRKRVIQNMRQEYKVKKARHELEAQMRLDTFDIAASERRTNKIMEEVEELMKQQRKAEADSLKDRIWAPTKRVLEGLEEKYKDAPIIGGLFQWQR